MPPIRACNATGHITNNTARRLPSEDAFQWLNRGRDARSGISPVTCAPPRIEGILPSDGREAPFFRRMNAGVEACVEQLSASSGDLLAPYCYAEASKRSLPWLRSTDLPPSNSKRT